MFSVSYITALAFNGKNMGLCILNKYYELFSSFTRYSWRHQMREFKSEFRVVALDLRGYGETDAPAHRENYKLDYLITDIKDILESLGVLLEAMLLNL